MKKNVFLILGLFLVSTFVFAQKSPAMTSESANVKVTYGAPSKGGRDIFGKLVPYGEVWRTGANAATEVTFKNPVTVAGVKVAAGTYSLFTIPTESGDWTLILNPELKQWGSYGYEKIKDKNVASVKVHAMKGSSSVEQLKITATDAEIVIEWDMAMVHVPLTW